MKKTSDEDIEHALATLTDVQAARLAANVSGETSSEIARREGVTSQSVDESLHRAELVLAGHVFSAKTNVDGKQRNIVEVLLTNLVSIATEATKPVIFGNQFRLVPDYATRMAATTRLLDMVAPAAPLTPDPGKIGGVSAETTIDESLEATRTESTTVRVSRRRSSRP